MGVCRNALFLVVLQTVNIHLEYNADVLQMCFKSNSFTFQKTIYTLKHSTFKSWVKFMSHVILRRSPSCSLILVWAVSSILYVAACIMLSLFLLHPNPAPKDDLWPHRALSNRHLVYRLLLPGEHKKHKQEKMSTTKTHDTPIRDRSTRAQWATRKTVLRNKCTKNTKSFTQMFKSSNYKNTRKAGS